MIRPIKVDSLRISPLVKEVLSADIVLGVSGPPLLLAMFMLPQSAILEILPKYEKEAKFYQFATSLNLLHYAHYQLTDSAFEDKAPNQFDAFIDEISMWIYMQDLVNMVLHNKYHISRVSSTNKSIH